MNNGSDVMVVVSTCPADHAQSLAESLVSERLAACVNIMPSVRSIYRWEGQICSDTESVLLIKTTRTGYPGLESRLTQLHPYEVPEVVALAVESGLSTYLDWVNESMSD